MREEVMKLFKKKKKKPVLKPNTDLEAIELPVGLEKKSETKIKNNIKSIIKARQSSEGLSVTDNGSETIDE
jgi:predicted RNase H-like nuclease